MAQKAEEASKFPFVELILDDTDGEETEMIIRGSANVPMYLVDEIKKAAEDAQEIAINGEKYLSDPQGDKGVVKLRLEYQGIKTVLTADFANGVKDGEPMSISKQILLLVMERVAGRSKILNRGH